MTTPEPSDSAGGPGPLEGQGEVEGIGSDEAPGGAAEQDGLEAAGDTAGQVEQLPEGDPEVDLVDPGPGHVAAEAEQLRPGRPLGPDGGVGRSPVGHDVEHVDQGLGVVDGGRPAEQAAGGRERRLLAGLAPEALDRVEQGRLLAADVGPGPPADLDLEVEARAGDARPEEAGLGGGVDGPGARRSVARGYSPRT